MYVVETMRLIVQRVLRGAVRVADKGTVGKIDRGKVKRRAYDDDDFTTRNKQASWFCGYREERYKG